jgi:hypothetical protein
LADTALVRKRRERAHRAGDHSSCRPEWCAQAPAPEPAPPGALEAAVTAYVERLELADGDPRAVTALVAVRLPRSMDARTTAAVARELRGCLDSLAYEYQEPIGADPAALEMLRSIRDMAR